MAAGRGWHRPQRDHSWSWTITLGRIRSHDQFAAPGAVSGSTIPDESGAVPLLVAAVGSRGSGRNDETPDQISLAGSFETSQLAAPRTAHLCARGDLNPHAHKDTAT